MKDDFGAAREFLEREWTGSEVRKIFAEVTWTAHATAYATMVAAPR